MKKYTHKIVLFIASLLIFMPAAYSCTRVLNANSNSVVVARTMDWTDELYTNLWIQPRGIERHGLVIDNPITWHSQYGSLITTAFDRTTTDGLNEAGLAAHILWLEESDYGTRDATQKGLSIVMWAQYYLDNFKNVSDAVTATQAHPFQLVGFTDPDTQKTLKLHLALDDASGDSAIIEYVGGKLHIHHNRENTVLTNSPEFSLQKTRLSQYDGFGGKKPLPGSTSSEDRYVRAAYFLKFLPKEDAKENRLAQTMSVLRNVAQPFHDKVKGNAGIEPTIWHSMIDFSKLKYYFKSTQKMNYIWTDLKRFDLSEGAPILKLDLVHHPELEGDVTKLFQPIN